MQYTPGFGAVSSGERYPPFLIARALGERGFSKSYAAVLSHHFPTLRVSSRPQRSEEPGRLTSSKPLPESASALIRETARPIAPSPGQPLRDFREVEIATLPSRIIAGAISGMTRLYKDSGLRRRRRAGRLLVLFALARAGVIARVEPAAIRTDVGHAFDPVAPCQSSW